MRKIIIPIASVVSLCLLVIMLNTTTPSTAGPFGLLAIFIFSYIVIFGAMAYLIYGISYLVSHLSRVVMSSRPMRSLSLKRSTYYSSVISTAPIMLVGLQSVGRVEIYQYFLVALFIVIGCLYIFKKIS